MFMHKFINKSSYEHSKIRSLIPVLLTMLVIRLYQVIDTRYASLVSKDVLTLYSIQISFLIFAQFFGNAAMNLILVMWHQTSLKPTELYEYVSKKLHKLNFFFILLCSVLLPLILNQFNLDQLTIQKTWIYLYFLLSLFCTIFISKQILLDSVLISKGQYKFVFYLATVSLFINIATDNFLLFLKNSNALADSHFLLLSSFITIGTFIFTNLMSKKIAFNDFLLPRNLDSVLIKRTEKLSKKREKQDSVPDFSRIDTLWKFELGVALSRSLPPFVFTYLCGFMLYPQDFLTIFFATSNIGFICTLPLIASLPLAIRNFTLSPEATENSTERHHVWLQEVISFGLLPALCALGLSTIFSKNLFYTMFHLELDNEHLSFVYLYFCGLAIAAFGHILTIPIRAKGKSYLIVRSLLLAEVTSNIAGMILLIIFGLATPLWVGILGIVYSFIYVFSNGIATLSLSPQRWHTFENKIK